MKEETKSTVKTFSIVGAGAAVVGLITYLALPTPLMLRPRSFKATTEGDSNWPIVYVWSYKDSVKDTNWKFFCYTTNTTLMTADATNASKFFTITEYFLVLPTWWTNKQQFRWKRTN